MTEERLEEQVQRAEGVVDAHVPGFRRSILARRVQSPVDLAPSDANLVDGAVASGRPKDALDTNAQGSSLAATGSGRRIRG